LKIGCSTFCHATSCTTSSGARQGGFVGCGEATGAIPP
jgi:hypothetical protein